MSLRGEGTPQHNNENAHKGLYYRMTPPLSPPAIAGGERMPIKGYTKKYHLLNYLLKR